MNDILNLIEMKKEQLDHLLEDYEPTSEIVIKASQELDLLIVNYMRKSRV